MRSPPKPTHSTSGQASRSARTRLLPWISPLGSPAEMKMRMAPTLPFLAKPRKGGFLSHNGHRGADKSNCIMPIDSTDSALKQGRQTTDNTDGTDECGEQEAGPTIGVDAGLHSLIRVIRAIRGSRPP